MQFAQVDQTAGNQLGHGLCDILTLWVSQKMICNLIGIF